MRSRSREWLQFAVSRVRSVLQVAILLHYEPSFRNISIRRAGTTNGTSRKIPDVCGRLVSTYSGQSSAGQSVAFYGSRCIFSTSTRAGSNRFNVQWQRSLSTAGLVLRHGQIAAKLAMGTTRLESFTLLSIVLSKAP